MPTFSPLASKTFADVRPPITSRPTLAAVRGGLCLVALCLTASAGVAQGSACEPWSLLGSGVGGSNPSVMAFAEFDDGSGDGPALYVGGSFGTAGDLAVNHLARWDGTSWSPVGDELSSTVRALAVFDDGAGGGPALYAGGFFEFAADTTVNRIARWDGAQWSSLGVGVSGGFPNVRALAVFDDGRGDGPALYAAGAFETAGNETAANVARWDGSSWSSVGGGLGSRVDALAVFDDGAGPALYAGGLFRSTAAGIPVNRVARWDGTAWSPLGSGMDNAVLALAVFDDGSGGGPRLHAGGIHAGVNGGFPDTTRGIARWNGSEWSALGNGFSAVFDLPLVHALAVFDDGFGDGPALFAGGNITSTDGVPVNGIAKWDGSAWSPLAGGLAPLPPSGPADGLPTAFALTVHDDHSGAGAGLYVGGSFEAAGGVAANSIARWQGCPVPTILDVTVICSGDGSGADCPCENTSAEGGCANSTSAGAVLDATSPSGHPAGTAALTATGLPPSSFVLFFQGSNAAPGAAGVTFGDGLLCCGGAIVRLEVLGSDASGNATSTVDIAALGGASAGSTLCYQGWYRDLAGPCSTGFNLTNGIEITWQ